MIVVNQSAADMVMPSEGYYPSPAEGNGGRTQTITANDSTAFTNAAGQKVICRYLECVTSGGCVVQFANGTQKTFAGLSAGDVFPDVPMQITHLLNTGTTGTYRGIH